ncbi:MAG: type II secretion system protein [Verrucomicrobiota bacterium]|nr:type II secretion system protein [Verrucomicrobiota bacterium]
MFKAAVIKPAFIWRDAHRKVLTRLPASQQGGFTLVELLVVIAIIAILASLLLPGLSSAKARSRKAVCISNLRQIGVAVQGYASDHEGRMPYGPFAPPFTSPASFYPSTGSPTSLISIQTGAPVGLGLLLNRELASQPKVLFCPGSDQPLDAEKELAKVGTNQAQGSYYYRHGGVTRLFYTPPTIPPNTMLDSPGTNRNGIQIRALAMDSIFLVPPDLAAFNVKPRTHHQQQFVNVLFTDGHVNSLQNKNAEFTIDMRNYGELQNAFDRILQAFERADERP